MAVQHFDSYVLAIRHLRKQGFEPVEPGKWSVFCKEEADEPACTVLAYVHRLLPTEVVAVSFVVDEPDDHDDHCSKF